MFALTRWSELSREGSEPAASASGNSSLRTEAVVGRGGLEPPTSAVMGPVPCTSESETMNQKRGVID